MAAAAPAPAEEMAFGEVLGPAPTDPSLPSPYRYTYVQYLGRGGYGLTYIVKRASDGHSLVVKIIGLAVQGGSASAGSATANAGAAASPSPLQGLEKSSLSKVSLEISNLQRISRHFGVTQLHEGVIVEKHALLFMEFCDAGDLHREISRQRKRGTQFPEDTIKIVLLQLVFSLHHLHRNRMMHRDVKASNVLLCTNGLVKLADFGLSKTVEQASTFCGTPTHLAPEVWEKAVYSSKADIWSLGVVLYHMMTLSVPFAARQYEVLRKLVVREDYKRPSTMRLPYSRELITLAERLLTKDASLRPDSCEILQTPIMQQMVARWPSLIESTPGISAELRSKILQCLREDGICDANGAPLQIIGLPSTAEGSPTEASDEHAVVFTINDATLADEARREAVIEARSSIELGVRNNTQAITDMSHHSSTMGSSSAVTCQGIVWKSKSGGWDMRGMILSPLQLILYSVETAVALGVLNGSLPVDALPSLVDAPNQQKMNLSHISDVLPADPVTVDPGTSGVGALGRNVLYPIRVLRKDGKSYDLAVGTPTEQGVWVQHLKTAVMREMKRTAAREERQSTAATPPVAVTPGSAVPS